MTNNEKTEKVSCTVNETALLPIPPEIQAQLDQTKLDKKHAKKQRVMVPNPGWTHNPLLRLPRNKECPCRSGKKFKVCCQRTLPRLVTVQDAKNFCEQMAKPDLVFMTKTNAEVLKKIAELRDGTELHEDKPGVPSK